LRWAVSAGWGVEPVPAVSSADLPAFVVQFEVVVFAEQHTPLKVGAAVISDVVVDVMCLTPGGWAFAVFPDAAAVADGEGDALVARVEALFAAEVEHIAEGVDECGLEGVRSFV
jgi:hypothetical protein